MDKALLDYEVSIDADCKTLTVGKPFAIEGKTWKLIIWQFIYLRNKSVIYVFFSILINLLRNELNYCLIKNIVD